MCVFNVVPEVKHRIVHPPAVDHSGKSALDLRDELEDTRQLLSGLSSERDGLRAEVNKLKQLIANKDRQIEDFLAEGRVGNRELVRLFGTGGQNSGINVSIITVKIVSTLTFCSLSHSLTLSHTLSLSHTHTHTLSLSLTHTHTHSIFSLFL